MMLSTRRYGRNFFEDMFGGDPFFSDFFKKEETALMKTDIKEQDGTYLLDMDLPGYGKEDISAELKDGYLTVTAQKNQENDEKDEEGNYLRRERYYGSCKRSFYVGENIKQEDIKASFKDGVLQLQVPKAEAPKLEDKSKYIAIE